MLLAFEFVQDRCETDEICCEENRTPQYIAYLEGLCYNPDPEVIKVRFGRRNKTKPISVRREVGDFPEATLGPVAAEERSALLSFESTGNAAPLPHANNGSGGGDPTQQLGTALGRFHRYVMKGQAGAPQEFWSDDCMNQLAAAIEIAISENWMHLVEALTDVARILQSYENAGYARQCVPFLIESYEILSLMVGDLMVNNTGSGVMEKWRERYRNAVDELTSAGLALVLDDDHEELGPHIPAERTPEIIPFERPQDEAAVAAAPGKEYLRNEPVLDSFFPFLDTRDAGEDAEEPAGAGVPPSPSAPESSVVLVEETPVAEARTEDTEAAALLDSLCDELSLLDKFSEAERAPRLRVVIEKVSQLEGLASERGLELPQRVCGRMTELCDAALFIKTRQTVAKRDGALLDRFLDTAYAFCEAYVEAAKDAESETAETWMSDTESLLDALAEAAQVENTEAVEEEAAVDGNASPESLLETAQKAVARGDVAGAKSLALQAAAHIARTEAEKAEDRVREAETRLREGADAIDRGRSGVKKSEQEVVVAESRVTEGEGELTDARESVTQATEKVGGIDRRAGEIDEQIRALMAARQAEEAKRAEANVELERNRELEIRAEADLRSLQEAEDAARLRLENTRQQVKDLQRRRTELEAALARGRETLTRHRASLSDIERTVSQLHSAGSPATAEAGEQQEELLF